MKSFSRKELIFLAALVPIIIISSISIFLNCSGPPQQSGVEAEGVVSSIIYYTWTSSVNGTVTKTYDTEVFFADGRYLRLVGVFRPVIGDCYRFELSPARDGTWYEVLKMEEVKS